MTPIRVLFLCRGNSGRSQMAEAFLRRYGKDRFQVSSAGIEPEPIDDLTIEVMRRAGMDLLRPDSLLPELAGPEASRSHAPRPQSKSVEEFLAEPFDFVITVCDDARDACPSFVQSGRLIHWRFQDPAAVQGLLEERRRAYLRVRDEIAGRVRLFAYAQTRQQDAIARDRALAMASSPAVANA